MRIRNAEHYRSAITEAEHLESAKEGTPEFERRHELLSAMFQYESDHKIPHFYRGRPDREIVPPRANPAEPVRPEVRPEEASGCDRIPAMIDPGRPERRGSGYVLSIWMALVAAGTVIAIIVYLLVR